MTTESSFVDVFFPKDKMMEERADDAGRDGAPLAPLSAFLLLRNNAGKSL